MRSERSTRWLDEVEARLAAATPGPWTQWVEHPEVFAGEITENAPHVISGKSERYVRIATCEPDEDEWGDCDNDEITATRDAMADAAFIAHAPADLRRLLAIARAAEKYMAADGSRGLYDAREMIEARAEYLGRARRQGLRDEAHGQRGHRR